MSIEESQTPKPCISDIIDRLKTIPRFGINIYRTGDYDVESEREYSDDGDYIESYDIDVIIRELEAYI